MIAHIDSRYKLGIITFILITLIGLPDGWSIAQSTETHTLILTNKAALIAQYGETETTDLLTELAQFAEHSAVNGTIIFVEETPDVAAAYTAWQGNLTSPAHANAVTEAIQALLFAQQRLLPDLEYIVLVGDDRIVPYRRVVDETPQFSERTYSKVSRNTTVGSALAANMFLSDDFYGVKESLVSAVLSTPTAPTQLISPMLAVGRLVETPAEMRAALLKFMETDGQIAVTNALVVGHDFMIDAAQSVCGTLTAAMAQPPDCSLISDTWQGETLLAQLQTGNAEVIFLHTHADHETVGAPDDTNIQATAASNWTASPNGRLIYSIGGHGGLNVPPEEQRPIDWPQVWLAQGAVYISSTGYDWALVNSIGLSEELSVQFAEAIAHASALPLGQALLSAKQIYVNSKENLSAYDKKIVNELTLYGLPMTKLVGFTTQPDMYESDNICSEAKGISTDGVPQSRTLYSETDTDWVSIEGSAGVTYQIWVTSLSATAGLTMQLFASCEETPPFVTAAQPTQPNDGVYMEFTAPATGRYYLRLRGTASNVPYNIFVRRQEGVSTPTPPVQTPTPTVTPTPTDQPIRGRVIIAAGRYKDPDPQQRNIHNVVDRVYRVFQAQGYSDDEIFLLATDDALPGYDGAATEETLRSAITEWAANQMQPGQPLTLYLIDHGSQDRFYLDKVKDQIVTPAELDDWLTAFEAAVPGAHVNVILEACFIGSFIARPQSISKPNRVVIASSDSGWSAYASPDGAFFSDYFLTALQQGRDLYASFVEARENVALALGHPLQNPWLDADGNSIPNQTADFAVAAERSFADIRTLPIGTQAPVIAVTTAQVTVMDGGGVLSAVIADDVQVAEAWAIIYPPSYVPPTNTEELLSDTAPRQLLIAQEADRYVATYAGFEEIGTYRIVFHAKDELGNLAKPVAIRVNVGSRLYLPLITR